MIQVYQFVGGAHCECQQPNTAKEVLQIRFRRFTLTLGTIGSQRKFQPGEVYHRIMYIFLIGVCHVVPAKLPAKLSLCIRSLDDILTVEFDTSTSQYYSVPQAISLLLTRV
ncbi:hypothetical protein BDV97DRAFT_351824, partial [Delphinella strobiligena]